MEDNNEKSEHEMWSGSGNSLSYFNLEDDVLLFLEFILYSRLVYISLKFACFGNH